MRDGFANVAVGGYASPRHSLSIPSSLGWLLQPFLFLGAAALSASSFFRSTAEQLLLRREFPFFSDRDVFETRWLSGARGSKGVHLGAQVKGDSGRT